MSGLLDPDSGCVGLERVVALAHRHLGMDVVCLVEMTDAGPVGRAAAGRPSPFRIVVGETMCEETPHCQMLLAGELPRVIPDAAT